MFPLPSASRTFRRAGFTLIELLVVITIIAVLASILLPVMSTVQNRARKVQCINDMRNVKTAMIAYYGDYHKYPLTDGQVTNAATNGNNQDTTFGDPGGYYPNNYLFDILRGIADQYNPSTGTSGTEKNPMQQVYWNGNYAVSATKPREGLSTQPLTISGQVVGAGALFDPWSNQYIIMVDATQDGDLSAQANGFYTDVSSTAGTVHPGLPPMGMEFMSLGPDGQFGTNGNHKLAGSDDIVTWQ